jgi:hypothetical protein
MTGSSFLLLFLCGRFSSQSVALGFVLRSGQCGVDRLKCGDELDLKRIDRRSQLVSAQCFGNGIDL